jgi:hypothetical protein
MVLPKEQKDNQDQDDNRQGSNQSQEQMGTGKTGKPFWLRFTLYFGLGMLIYYVFFLIRVRPWVFSDYAAWVAFSIVFGCLIVLAEFLGIKLFGLFGGDKGKDSGE